MCGVIVIYGFHSPYNVAWIAKFMEDVPQFIAICFIKCFSKLIKAMGISKLKSLLFCIICCAMNILCRLTFAEPLLLIWNKCIHYCFEHFGDFCIYFICTIQFTNASIIVTICLLYLLEEWNNVDTSPSMRYRACYTAGIEDSMQSSSKG